MPNSTIFIIAAVGFLVFVGIVLAIFFSFYRTWMRAFLAGTRINFLNLVFMKVRGSDMNKIVNQCIAANQAGFPVSCTDMERAWLRKVDIEKVTLAYITARKRDQDFSFQELVEAEREGRLERLLR